MFCHSHGDVSVLFSVINKINKCCPGNEFKLKGYTIFMMHFEILKRMGTFKESS